MKQTHRLIVTFELEQCFERSAWLWLRFSGQRRMPVASFYAGSENGSLVWHIAKDTGLASRLTKRTIEMRSPTLEKLVDAVLRDLGVPAVEVGE